MNYLRREAGFYVECPARRQRSPGNSIRRNGNIVADSWCREFAANSADGLGTGQLRALVEECIVAINTKRRLRQEIVRLLKLINSGHFDETEIRRPGKGCHCLKFFGF